MGWPISVRSVKEAARRECGYCDYFRNDPAFIEASIKGMTSFGSGYASVRADDGICTRHDRYLGASSSCADFIPVKDPA